VTIRFSKMHGIGNDFVVVDWRARPHRIASDLARRLADRHLGVGCDQLLSIENASDPACVFRYGIWNTDGSEAGQCGNGVRCVAAWLFRAGLIGHGEVRLQSPSGAVSCELLADDQVRVEMGMPRFEPAEIPLRSERISDVYRLTLKAGTVDVAAVSMGNPHAVLRVEDIAKTDVQALGQEIESHVDFPERCNVGFMQLLARDRIRLRVYERGVGETLACGTGACAAAVIGMRAGHLERTVRVSLPGGDLWIAWPNPNGPVSMTGPTKFVYEGEWHDD
jgi:diaminopimelate epimerase